MKRPQCPYCHELLFDVREVGRGQADGLAVDDLLLIGDCDHCNRPWTLDSSAPLVVKP